MPTEPNPPKVFISYSHDSQEHRLRVYELLRKLRADGIHCVTDHLTISPPEGWQAWMEDRIKEADFTLVVCTETYRRRAERKEQPGVGLGVTWEVTLITNEIYQNNSYNTKFIPVLFTPEDAAHRPVWLGQVSYYRVDLEDGYELLLRHLTNQPLFEEPPVAERVRELPPITRKIEASKPKPESQPAPPPPVIVAPPPKPKVVHQNFTENLGNGVTLEMVALPGGTFQMGSNEYDSEKPVHPVTLSPFHIGQYQITQAQWQAVMRNNPSRFKGDNLPVECVSWQMAFELCLKLSEKTGKEYRLPTEAEWEYACRAGSTARYCFGDDDAGLEKYAWYNKNAGGKTHPVGEKLPNDWGLHDMHGNVWEWCQDWYDENYYRQSPKENPPGPSSGEYRVLRGGSWGVNHIVCRCGRRFWDAPGFINYVVGVRVVCVARTP